MLAETVGASTREPIFKRSISISASSIRNKWRDWDRECQIL